MIGLIDDVVSKEKVRQKECSKGRWSGRRAARVRHVDSRRNVNDYPNGLESRVIQEGNGKTII